MSKPFMIGILVILCGLLYATSFALKKSTEPPPTPKSAMETMSPAEKAKTEAEMKKMMKDKMKSEMEHREKMEAEIKRRAKLNGTKAIMPSAPELDLNSNWYRKRKDGADGIKIMEATRSKESPSLPAQPTVVAPSAVSDDADAHRGHEGHDH